MEWGPLWTNDKLYKVDWISLIKPRLLPKEDLLISVSDVAIVTDIALNFSPTCNASSLYPGFIGLTGLRLIVVWSEDQFRILNVPYLKNFSESVPYDNQKNWSYRAFLAIPGSIQIIVQAKNAEQEQKLSSLLTQALMTLDRRNDSDSDSILFAKYDRMKKAEDRAASGSDLDDHGP